MQIPDVITPEACLSRSFTVNHKDSSWTQTMSSPAPAIRDQLNAALADKASHYWDTLNAYLGGKISRVEFEELVREVIDNPNLGECISIHMRMHICLYVDYFSLVQLHNSLIISVLGSSLHHAPPTPPPDAPGKPLRKKRRVVGGEVDEATQSSRLKQWAVGVGKRERERIKALETISKTKQVGPRPELDEIASERGVQLVPEGRGQKQKPIHRGSS